MYVNAYTLYVHGHTQVEVALKRAGMTVMLFSDGTDAVNVASKVDTYIGVDTYVGVED